MSHDSNIVIGSGWLFVDVFDAAGQSTGERYIAETSELTIEIDEERTEILSHDGPIATTIVNNVVSRSYTARVTAHDMGVGNFALLLGGTTAEEADSDAAVVDETRRVQADRWYQLGATATKPMGVLDVVAATVHATAAATEAGAPAGAAIVQGQDFDVDAGRIRIRPDFDAAATPWIAVDYQPVANVHLRATAGAGRVRGAVRYVEGAAAGRNVRFADCEISGDGAAVLKSGDRQTPQSIPLMLSVIERAGRSAPITVDGAALAGDGPLAPALTVLWGLPADAAKLYRISIPSDDRPPTVEEVGATGAKAAVTSAALFADLTAMVFGRGVADYVAFSSETARVRVVAAGTNAPRNAAAGSAALGDTRLLLLSDNDLWVIGDDGSLVTEHGHTNVARPTSLFAWQGKLHFTLAGGEIKRIDDPTSPADVTDVTTIAGVTALSAATVADGRIFAVDGTRLVTLDLADSTATTVVAHLPATLAAIA